MSDKFLNSTGLATLRDWVLTKLGLKQDALVSGTNIKTINNTSLLGSGNIDISSGGGDVFVATCGVTPVQDVIDAWNANKVIYLKDDLLRPLPVMNVFEEDIGTTGFQGGIAVIDHNSEDAPPWYGWADFIYDQSTETYSWGSGIDFYELASKIAVANEYATQVYVDDAIPKQATETVAGIVKLNPSESISVNSNGQLTVGGRLGQFPDGGLYYPTSADPVSVGNYTLLMSEAKGLSAAHRELIIAGGSTVTLKTAAAAGATQYRISNTQNNRFLCLAWVGGRLAVSEAEAKNKTVAITSIKFANGNDISAYFGGTESNNDIIITVAETLNPSGTLSGVRGYGTWLNADIVSAGQGNKVGGGKTLQVGQGLSTANNVNQIGMVGIRQFNSGGNSFMVGSDNINKKNFSAIFGQGIDNSTGVEGLAAFGKYPIISSDTAFVVGNGTAYNERSNLFEIKTNGDIYKNGVQVL